MAKVEIIGAIKLYRDKVHLIPVKITEKSWKDSVWTEKRLRSILQKCRVCSQLETKVLTAYAVWTDMLHGSMCFAHGGSDGLRRFIGKKELGFVCKHTPELFCTYFLRMVTSAAIHSAPPPSFAEPSRLGGTYMQLSLHVFCSWEWGDCFAVSP